MDTCIACGKPLVAGELVLFEKDGGEIHVDCCGPEREGYCNEAGDPLGPDDPIPTGHPYVPDPYTPQEHDPS